MIEYNKAPLRPEGRCFPDQMGLTQDTGAQKSLWCRTYNPPKAECQNYYIYNPGHIARLLSRDVCSSVSNALSICAMGNLVKGFFTFCRENHVSTGGKTRRATGMLSSREILCVLQRVRGSANSPEMDERRKSFPSGGPVVRPYANTPHAPLPFLHPKSCTSRCGTVGCRGCVLRKVRPPGCTPLVGGHGPLPIS